MEGRIFLESNQKWSRLQELARCLERAEWQSCCNLESRWLDWMREGRVCTEELERTSCVQFKEQLQKTISLMNLQAILHIREHWQAKFERNLDVSVLIHASPARFLSVARFELVVVE